MTWGLWGHTASAATKDDWESGETAHYEYHCLQSPESSDYHLWRRSHQPGSLSGSSLKSGSSVRWYQVGMAVRAAVRGGA